MFLSMFGLLWFSAVFFWSFGGHFSGCNHRMNFILWLDPFFWRFRGMFLSMFGLLWFSAVFFWSFGGDFSGCNHRLKFSLWLGPFFWRFLATCLSLFGLLWLLLSPAQPSPVQRSPAQPYIYDSRSSTLWRQRLVIIMPCTSVEVMLFWLNETHVYLRKSMEMVPHPLWGIGSAPSVRHWFRTLLVAMVML